MVTSGAKYNVRIQFIGSKYTQDENVNHSYQIYFLDDALVQ